MADDETISQFKCDAAVMYNDDRVCVKYEDGSVLELSPCSSSFRYKESQAFSPPSPRRYYQQLSRFAVNSLKTKVIWAVNLRNKYATRPYLCKELLSKEMFTILNHHEVSECVWPQTLCSECISHNNKGSVVIKSLDGFARLTLSSHKRSFFVSYLTKVQNSKEPTKYVWMNVAEQAVQDCTPCWTYPLRLALEKSDDKLHASHELLALSNISKLPQTLPVTCNNPHLHNWTVNDQVFTGGETKEIFWQPNAKVVWRNNIVYRVNRHKEDMVKVDVYPGDGSIFTSSGVTGKFFSHFSITDTEGKMFTSDKPPPDRPGLNYSIAKILRQGSSLFNFILHTNLLAKSEPSICWTSKASKYKTQKAREPPCISETAFVPNVGKFVAYSNGHLHIAFVDRTLINIRYRPGKEDLWFNCTLANGQVLEGHAEGLPGLERYIKVACEWGDWVNSSSQQRETFYKDTMWDPDQQRLVEAEIRKLQRFNYILDHGALLTYTDSKKSQDSQLTKKERGPTEKDQVKPDKPEKPDILMALKDTTNAISDIDRFLSNVKTILCNN